MSVIKHSWVSLYLHCAAAPVLLGSAWSHTQATSARRETVWTALFLIFVALVLVVQAQ